MNLLLFTPGEWEKPLSGNDDRIKHIHSIMKLKAGDSLDAGVIGGSLGRALIKEIRDDGSCLFDYSETGLSTPLCPLTLIIGTPRPPTAKRLLRDLAAAGIERIIFTGTDLGEKSYLTSRLWSKDEWKEAVLLGMAQGESSLSPQVDKFYSLYKAIEHIPENRELLALDNISPDLPLKGLSPRKEGCCLALGPERGWSDREREILREKNFRICSLGKRVLRTETAAHMGTALIQAALDYI